MTGNDALEALLARLAASYDGSVFFSVADLRKWPKVAVSAFQKAELLKPAAPAVSVTCNGCGQHCSMPVEIVAEAGRSAAFVVCDKREDINRVDVPLERLERWQASCEAMAAFLAATLDINRPLNVATQVKRWDVGRLRSKRIEPVVLRIVEGLTVVECAGHSVPLDEVLSLKGGRLALDRQTLNACVDNPASTRPGRIDVAARVAQLDADIEDNRRRGVRAPVETAMRAANITRQRLHEMRKTLKRRKASPLT